MTGKCSGGFQYNLTTQSQFQFMKQQNSALLRQNSELKESLSQLIKINNELTDSLEEFNNSVLSNGVSKSEQNEKLKNVIQQLTMKLGYDQQKRDNSQMIQALQKLIYSFNEMKVVYQNEIESLCRQLQIQKQQGQEKIKQLEQRYLYNLNQSEQLINFLKRKQQILGIIEKKSLFCKQDNSNGCKLGTSRRVNIKYDIQTISQREKISRSDRFYDQKQIQQLKNRQRQLQKQLNQKNRVLSTRNQLLNKLKKKLIEKY